MEYIMSLDINQI